MVNVAVALEDRRTALGGDGAAEMISPAPISIDLVFEDAFEDLYGRAYGVAFQLLGRRTEAEDVAQEALARAFVHWRKIRGYAEAWVVRVAGNLAIDTWRKRRHVDEHRSTDDTPGVSPAPSALRIDLHQALAHLSKRQREVLVLRFLADLPEADVARVLGCSVGSVKQHASRGLATLRTSMGTADEEIL
jgi:RNA polymerase sigma-70 factor (sigma-E family)